MAVCSTAILETTASFRVNGTCKWYDRAMVAVSRENGLKTAMVEALYDHSTT